MAAIGTLPVLFATGNHAGRPAASAVGKGGLYSCTTHALVYQTDGSSWSTWATLGAAASGSITASGYTQNTARLLGRTTGSSGAIEEISVGTGLTLSAGSLTASAGTMTQLYDTTLVGTATSIDTSTVLAGYNHLRAVLHGRTDRSGQVFEGVDLQFNGDTGSNYDSTNGDTSASTTTYGESIGGTSGQCASFPGNNAPANTPGSVVIDIPHYGGTTFHKGYVSIGGVKYGTSAGNIHTATYSGVWRSTSAITRLVVLTRNGSNFVVGTRLTVYGLT